MHFYFKKRFYYSRGRTKIKSVDLFSAAAFVKESIRVSATLYFIYSFVVKEVSEHYIAAEGKFDLGGHPS